MLSNKSRPVIGKLIIGSGYRTGVVTSPRSPLDMKILSPTGGIGLGILAALEKSGEADKALCSRSFSRSDPIPVSSSKDSGRIKGGVIDEIDPDSLEDYTYVTCHRPGNRSFTRVYRGNAGVGTGAGAGERGRKVPRGGGFEGSSIFDISPARLRDVAAPAPADYPTSDFLSSCNMCNKNLEGKDIYMYRGEKAFCSTECRSMQISMDERASSSISRSVNVSNSPCGNDQIFFSTGILAI